MGDNIASQKYGHLPKSHGEEMNEPEFEPRCI